MRRPTRPALVVWLGWLVSLIWAVPGFALRVLSCVLRLNISQRALVAVAVMLAVGVPRGRLWPWHDRIRLALAWLAAATAYAVAGVYLR